MMHRHLRRVLRSLLGAAALTTANVGAAGGQISYDGTTFLHGTGSRPQIWWSTYADIGTTPPGYLDDAVQLGRLEYPNLDYRLPYKDHISILDGFLGTRGGRQVMVGHSLGSLEARGAYLQLTARRPNITGIVAVAAPHQGTLLANNKVRARDFFREVQYRVDRGLNAAELEAAILGVVISGRMFDGMVLSLLFPDDRFPSVADLSDLTRVPAIDDQRTDSPVIADLNRYTYDAAIPRGNIYSSISHRNAAIRVAMSLQNKDHEFGSTVRQRNKAVSALQACKAVGYLTIVLTPLAERCASGERAFKAVDPKWSGFVNGTVPKKVWIFGQELTVHLPRLVPFDGIVSNERSRYPGLTDLSLDRLVDINNNVNHQNIYKTRAGLDMARLVMLRMGMLAAAPPPPPPPPPPDEPPPSGCPDDPRREEC